MTDKFWKDQGLKHITPRNLKNPEGFDAGAVLRGIIGSKKVIEVGCGYGRLCQSFTKDQYIGFDINSDAIEKAKKTYHGFEFSESKDHEADVTLLYTVLLHIEDSRIGKFIGDLSTNSVVVAEIMDKNKRIDGDIPAFNRNPEDYTALFEKAGYKLAQSFSKPYKYYRNTEITFMEFKKC
jgi:SAM-dependent methyltransferase